MNTMKTAAYGGCYRTETCNN